MWVEKLLSAFPTQWWDVTLPGFISHPLYCNWGGFGCKICVFLYIISEKAMAPHSSTLAWKIPWTEEPGGLQSMGSWGAGHNWATSLSLFTFMHWRRRWQPTPVFLPGESQGRGAWWAAVYGVTQSRTQLKRLSSSSNSIHYLLKVMGRKHYNLIIKSLLS